MGLTVFPNGIYATPNLGGSMLTQGNVYFVKPYSGSDSKDGKTPDTAWKTLAHAQAVVVADQNDTVYMFQESNTGSKTTDYYSTNLAWAKDGVHLIGVATGPNLYMGQRARVSNLSTAASFANLFTLSANNCMICGIEFFQGAGSDTLSAAQTCVTISGNRNLIQNCQISGMGDTTMDYTGSNSLTVSGLENCIKNCYIGLDTVIRGTSVTEVIIAAAATRNIFEDCIFNTYTSGANFKMITFQGASSHTLTVIKNCIVNNETNRTGVATTTGAIDPGSIAGHIVILGGAVAGFSAGWCSADSALLKVQAPIGVATTKDMGVAPSWDKT